MAIAVAVAAAVAAAVAVAVAVVARRWWQLTTLQHGGLTTVVVVQTNFLFRKELMKSNSYYWTF